MSPVREWLMELDREDRREVGRSLMTLEFGWPVGMPLARAMGGGLHELRIAMEGNRNARVFFYIDRQQQIVLLHAFVKANSDDAEAGTGFGPATHAPAPTE